MTTWFSSSFKNLRRISMYFLFWWVVVRSNVNMKVSFNLLSFVASQCDNNETNPSCKIWYFLSTHSKSFCHIWIRKYFLKQGIPVHALRLNTHSAFEAEICSFKMGSNEMVVWGWWWWNFLHRNCGIFCKKSPAIVSKM